VFIIINIIIVVVDVVVVVIMCPSFSLCYILLLHHNGLSNYSGTVLCYVVSCMGALFNLLPFPHCGSACCCMYFIKVIGRTVPRNNYLRCLFIFISPLRVSALTGQLQAEYTIILIININENVNKHFK
jgi:hypothetical protein